MKWGLLQKQAGRQARSVGGQASWQAGT